MKFKKKKCEILKNPSHVEVGTQRRFNRYSTCLCEFVAFIIEIKRLQANRKDYYKYLESIFPDFHEDLPCS